MVMPVASQTFNFIEPQQPVLLLSALENAVEVAIHYLPSRIAPPANPVIAAPVLAHRVKVEAWSSVRQALDMAHPAFSDRVGAVRLESHAPRLFYAYMLDETDACLPITGPELISTLFRVPVAGDTQDVKIAVTNVSPVVSTLEFTVRGARPQVQAAMLGPGVTYLFEPARIGWAFSAPAAIEVHTGQPSVCSARLAQQGRASVLYPLPG